MVEILVDDCRAIARHPEFLKKLQYTIINELTSIFYSEDAVFDETCALPFN